MSKYFRPWNIDQTLLLPPNVQDFVPKGHVSRFIVELVRESLDLKEITGSYVSGLGQPPFDPRMMVALLLHGYWNEQRFHQFERGIEPRSHFFPARGMIAMIAAARAKVEIIVRHEMV
jgi:hypothetical protein